MQNYVFNKPTKIYFGKGQISNLESLLSTFGKNVLLVYGGGSIKKIGLYDEIMEILNNGGFNVTELSGVEPNPRIETVAKGVALCKTNNIDVVLAAGGGSTIDCCKAICTGVYYDGDLWEMVRDAHAVECGGGYDKERYDRVIGTHMYGPRVPLVNILTVSATGTELNSGGVISNPETNEKFGGQYTFAAATICDPTYTFTVPKYHTAAGSFDIMSHLMEDYFSRTEDSDLSEGLTETALRSVIKNLPIALAEPDNYSARANLMACSNIGCSGIPSFGKLESGWVCHCMEHEVSAYYDITHGVGLAILTPRWMRHILAKDPSCAWRFARFAKNVWGLEGDDEMQLAWDGIAALEDFIKTLDIPTTFTEVGIDSANFRNMAEHASPDGFLEDAFVGLSVEDIIAIFEACL